MYTKYCSYCDTDKSVDDFGKKGYGQRHYQANKEQYATRARAHQKAMRRRLYDLKEASPCTDCGLFFPYYVMQYDHTALVTRVVPWDKVEAEIAKCELVCVDCHCVRTHQRRVDAGVEDE